MSAFDIKQAIRTTPDHPKPGVMFRDITTLLKDPRAFGATVEQLLAHCGDLRFNKVVGIEARGFIFAAVIAHHLGMSFVPMRKQGKLPAEVVGHDYTLEYGTDRVEIHADALCEEDRVLLVDDLIATGGTAIAAVKLIEKLGSAIAECCFVVELPELGGRKQLTDMGQTVFSLCTFSGH